MTAMCSFVGELLWCLCVCVCTYVCVVTTYRWITYVPISGPQCVSILSSLDYFVCYPPCPGSGSTQGPCWHQTLWCGQMAHNKKGCGTPQYDQAELVGPHQCLTFRACDKHVMSLSHHIYFGFVLCVVCVCVYVCMCVCVCVCVCVCMCVCCVYAHMCGRYRCLSTQM